MDEPSTQHERNRLLAELAAGSEAAFARLYDQFGGPLYRTAFRLLGRRGDAQDAVQDVFMALVRSRERLVHVQDLPAYLFASLRRAAARCAARRGRENSASDWEGNEPVDRAADHEDHRGEFLEAALISLSHEQREVIALKIEGGLTFAQIGRVLDISPHTAASRYRYALEHLRDRLNR